jgi:hypothetical protein
MPKDFVILVFTLTVTAIKIISVAPSTAERAGAMSAVLANERTIVLRDPLRIWNNPIAASFASVRLFHSPDCHFLAHYSPATDSGLEKGTSASVPASATALWRRKLSVARPVFGA